eukprot:scaffold8253_cov267-Pinguiococcus_pyrenoidosus.AAC.4
MPHVITLQSDGSWKSSSTLVGIATFLWRLATSSPSSCLRAFDDAALLPAISGSLLVQVQHDDISVAGFLVGFALHRDKGADVLGLSLLHHRLQLRRRSAQRSRCLPYPRDLAHAQGSADHGEEGRQQPAASASLACSRRRHSVEQGMELQLPSLQQRLQSSLRGLETPLQLRLHSVLKALQQRSAPECRDAVDDPRQGLSKGPQAFPTALQVHEAAVLQQQTDYQGRQSSVSAAAAANCMCNAAKQRWPGSGQGSNPLGSASKGLQALAKPPSIAMQGAEKLVELGALALMPGDLDESVFQRNGEVHGPPCMPSRHSTWA